MDNKKVYCVFQSSGSYDTYYEYMEGVCSTYEKAVELKKEMDKKVVHQEEVYNIVPQHIFENWPETQIDKQKDIWEPVQIHEGYTKEQYDKQLERWYLYMEDYTYATIKEYVLL